MEPFLGSEYEPAQRKPAIIRGLRICGIRPVRPDARSLGEAFFRFSRLWSVLACGGKGKEADFPFAQHLDMALAVEVGFPSLGRLIEGFKAIEPELQWRRRTQYDDTASENFVDGHANAMIIGPGGLRNEATFGSV